jgi:hypothetical protein
MKSEIVIPKWAWITGVLVFLLGLGLLTSPRDKDHHPLLLLPDVKALEDYRRSLVDWHARFREIDGRMTRLLSDDYGGDLFSQSSEGQKIQNETIQLLQEIDQTSTPPAAISARDMALGAGSAYLEASRAMLSWISAPTATNLDLAQQSLDSAFTTLSKLEASQWMAVNP